MTRVLLPLFLFCLFFGAQAQQSEFYSYITDRKFSDPTDLIGFNFVPGGLEIRDQRMEELDPGDYAFGLTQNNLYVDGEGIKGVYNLNNIEPVEYGFKARLMNARNPMVQGHLKIILTPKGYVEALIFKRSTEDPEMIFFQQEIPKKLATQESDFFTDLNEVEIEVKDSLWGKSVRPFFLMHDDINVQQRLHMKDSTRISFSEEIEIVDKSKKKKKRKKRKKRKEKEMEDQVAEEATETAAEPVSEELVSESGEDVKAEDTEEEEEEEEPPLTREEILALDEDELKEREIKLVRTHFLHLDAIITYDDGSVEEKADKYRIEKVVEREDDQAGPGEDRYQWEVKIYKKDPIYIYFRADRTISSVEFGPKRYLMRGY